MCYNVFTMKINLFKYKIQRWKMYLKKYWVDPPYANLVVNVPILR